MDEVEEILADLDLEHVDPKVGLDDDEFLADIAADELALAALGASAGLADGAAADMEDLELAMDDAGLASTDLIAGLEPLADATDDTALATQGAVQQFDNWELGVHDLDDALRVTEDTLDAFMNDTISADEALQTIEATGINVEQMLEDVGLGVQDFGLAFADAEGAVEDTEKAINDLEGTLQATEGFANDLALGIDEVAKALKDVSGDEGGGGGGLGGLLGALGASGGAAQEALSSVVSSLTSLPILIATAIPLVGALVGEFGALSAIGFTAISGLGAAIIGLIPDFGQIEDAVKFFAKLYEDALKPFDATVVPPLIKVISEAFQAMLPVAESADEALTEIFNTLSQQMAAPPFQLFVEWVADNAGPALKVLANFITDITRSLGEMGVNGQPFINMLESGLSSLGQDLVNFAGSNTFKDFVNWLTNNGPTIGGDLEHIGEDIGKIAASFASVGLKFLNGATDIVNAITPILSAIGDWLGRTDTVQKTWDRVWGDIKSTFDSVWGDIRPEIEQIGNDLNQWIVTDGINRVERAWDVAWGSIKNDFSTQWGIIKSTASEIGTDLKNWIEDPINDAEKAWDSAWGSIKSGFDTAWGGVKSSLSTISSDLDKAIVAPIQLAESAWDFAWAGMKSGLSSIWDGIKTIFDDITHGIADVVTAAGKLSGVLSTIGKIATGGESVDVLGVHIPYAAGGLVDGPTRALLGEGGEKEMVIPESKFPGGFGGAKTPEDLFALPSVGTVGSGGGESGGGSDYYHYGDVNVHSPSKDPQQVAKEVINQILINQRGKGVKGAFAQSANRRGA